MTKTFRAVALLALSAGLALAQSAPGPARQAASGAFVALLIALYVAVYAIPFWRIFRKLNHNPGLALLVWVPGVNLIVLYYVAFSAPRTPRQL